MPRLQLRPPPELMSELLESSRYGASSLLLSQSSGGNTSVKSAEADLLWVKASGISLAEVNEQSGFVAVRYSALRRLVQAGTPSVGDRRGRHEECVRLTQEAALDPRQGRPSLEATFHALFPEPVLLHLHPVFVNAFTCMENGHEALAEAARRSFVWVEYAAPGQELAAKLAELLAGPPAKASVSPPIVMQNHGFIAPAANARDAIKLTHDFVNAGERFLGPLDAGLYESSFPSQPLLDAAETICGTVNECWPGENLVVRPARYRGYQEFCRDSRFSENAGPLVPDDVVYSGNGLRVQSLQQGLMDIAAERPEKMAIAVEGTGVVLIARNERLVTAMEETLLAHVLIRMLITRRGKVRTLPKSEVDYLKSMESEKYRIKVTSKA